MIMVFLYIAMVFLYIAMAIYSYLDPISKQEQFTYRIGYLMLNVQVRLFR